MNRREMLAGMGALTAIGWVGRADAATSETPRNGGSLRLALAGRARTTASIRDRSTIPS